MVENKTLCPVDTLPTHPKWILTIESETKACWDRTNVKAEALATDYDHHNPEDYRNIDERKLKYSIILNHIPDEGWAVSFTSPNPCLGMVDYDPQFSISRVSLDTALEHIRTVLKEKSA